VPINGKKGFGFRARLRGHSRVPLPPQRITGIILLVEIARASCIYLRPLIWSRSSCPGSLLRNARAIYSSH